jgi:hypothetical protein
VSTHVSKFFLKIACVCYIRIFSSTSSSSSSSSGSSSGSSSNSSSVVIHTNLCNVFTIIDLKQTMFIGYNVANLLRS